MIVLEVDAKTAEAGTVLHRLRHVRWKLASVVALAGWADEGVYAMLRHLKLQRRQIIDLTTFCNGGSNTRKTMAARRTPIRSILLNLIRTLRKPQGVSSMAALTAALLLRWRLEALGLLERGIGGRRFAAVVTVFGKTVF